MDAPRPKIMIVDDDPALLKMIAMFLNRMGYDITTKDATDRAWAEMESCVGEFAGAVLDASMGGLSTQDLALRLLGANPSLCVVVASGYPVDMTAMESAAPGRVMFLHKPFAPKMLTEAVRRMIASQEEAL